MKNIVFDVRDFGGQPHADDVLVLWSPDLRGSVSRPDGVVAPYVRRVPISGGSARVADVEPGRLCVRLERCHAGATDIVTVTVPSGSGDVSFRQLLEASVPYEEPVITRVSELAATASVAADRAQRDAELASSARGAAVATAAASARDTANAIRSEISGLSEQARRASESAGTHETRARGHADRAASAAADAVARAVNQLKGAAPAAFDTLAEIADRIKAGGSLESELLRKIAEKASNADFQTLKTRVDRLGISAVSGLVSALAGKADASHRHSASDLTEATPNVIHNWLVKRDAAGRAQVAAPAGSTDIANKGYVDAKHMVLGPASGGSGVTARKTGRLVMVRVEGATAGNKGTLPAGYRPISTVDFFLTNPNSRSYPGWCNILTDGTVFVNFSNSSGSNSGYGVVTYISDS
ncbi:hypothetical protein CMUST_15685 (plasmid) [Corynebacterium mustelae]|uniref:Uncharacterized protein n=1 Tax=Corynebacterium mustelae TaxID=571915 RepID=A0A0G3H3U9_9CORY|nr:hypothetical protein [Corynebacterium mustelae]AKK05249.1 hypothetical protein CMUST_04535 [Corynebacterium mustelae]AKK07425.1 hypothetical protein CMUST_15685 [Corynebacterium mustelae]